MKLSLTELRRIISEEAEIVDASSDQLPPEIPDIQASDNAKDLVGKLGFVTEALPEGESVGSSLLTFLTVLEEKAPDQFAKLLEPANIAAMIQIMGDHLTLEVLEITGIVLEGMPTKEEMRKKLTDETPASNDTVAPETADAPEQAPAAPDLDTEA